MIPRFKNLFSIKKDASNLRRHADRVKKDHLLTHPDDSPAWKTINILHKTFRDEDHNLRLGLCTNKMNPFSNFSSQHSTWPVPLVIYNLPPWFCMKRTYIMLLVLILGPKQHGNDIDIYFSHLVEDERVSMFNAHVNEVFILRAMLLCIVNDFSAYENVLGYKNKRKKACPIM